MTHGDGWKNRLLCNLGQKCKVRAVPVWVSFHLETRKNWIRNEEEKVYRSKKSFNKTNCTKRDLILSSFLKLSHSFVQPIYFFPETILILFSPLITTVIIFSFRHTNTLKPEYTQSIFWSFETGAWIFVWKELVVCLLQLCNHTDDGFALHTRTLTPTHTRSGYFIHTIWK